MSRYLSGRRRDPRPVGGAQQISVTLERTHGVAELSVCELARAVELREVPIELAISVGERA